MHKVMGHENSKVREIPNLETRNLENPSTPVTVPNAPTQIDIQTNPRDLIACDDIYCTWFCFSLFTDGFANWRLV